MLWEIIKSSLFATRALSRAGKSAMHRGLLAVPAQQTTLVPVRFRLRGLQFPHHQEDDEDEEEQSAWAIVEAATTVKAATEGENQKNDQNNTERADGEGAASELHGMVNLRKAGRCQSFPQFVSV